MAKTLQQLIDELVGTPTGPVGRANTVTVTTAEVVVLPADPNRVAAVLVNLSGNVLFVTPTGTPTTTNGIRLAPNGGNMVLNWKDDLFLVGREWRAVADVGSNTLYRLEVATV